MLKLLLMAVTMGGAAWSQSVVGVFVDAQRPLSNAVLQTIEDQTSKLLAPTGLRFAWRDLAANTGTESFSRVFFLKFKGTCSAPSLRQAQSLPEPFAEPERLAATKIIRGEVIPETEVECDNLRHGFLHLPVALRSVAFGEALARVIAHEFYHVLADTAEHGRKGLAKSVVTWQELSSAVLGFDQADLKKMGQAVKPVP